MLIFNGNCPYIISLHLVKNYVGPRTVHGPFAKNVITGNYVYIFEIITKWLEYLWLNKPVEQHWLLPWSLRVWLEADERELSISHWSYDCDGRRYGASASLVVLSVSLHVHRYHNLLMPATASLERLMKQAGPWSRKDKLTMQFDLIVKTFVTC